MGGRRDSGKAFTSDSNPIMIRNQKRHVKKKGLPEPAPLLKCYARKVREKALESCASGIPQWRRGKIISDSSGEVGSRGRKCNTLGGTEQEEEEVLLVKS